MDIRYHTRGTITAGEHIGWGIEIVESEGGAWLVLLTGPGDHPQSFDDWVEDNAQLERHFRDCGWQVDWQPLKT